MPYLLPIDTTENGAPREHAEGLGGNGTTIELLAGNNSSLVSFYLPEYEFMSARVHARVRLTAWPSLGLYKYASCAFIYDRVVAVVVIGGWRIRRLKRKATLVSMPQEHTPQERKSATKKGAFVSI